MSFLSDLAAERGILSGVYNYGKDAYLDARDIVDAKGFTEPTNQILYSIFCHILKKDLYTKLDIPTILSSAKELGLDKHLSDKTNSQYLQKITTFHVELSNVREFARKVRTLQEARNLIGVVSDAQEKVRESNGDESISEIVAKVEGPLLTFTSKLALSNQQIQHVGDGLIEYLEDKINNPPEFVGIPIGFPKYEEAIGGLESGLHVITARPKKGKSSHAVNAALYTAHKPKIPVLYVDTELSLRNGQWNRMLARVSGVPFKTIRNGRMDEIQRKKVRKAARILSTLPLDYVNISGKDFEEVIAIIRRWLIQKVGYGLNGELNKCLVIYDYIKLTDYASLKNAQEYAIIGMRMSLLHDICETYSIPILTYTQLNRELGVSQSDRILWYCTSMSSMQEKTPEEIAEDGRENGNRKIIVQDCRFGEGLADGDYINYNLDGARTTLMELRTRNELGKERQENNRDSEEVEDVQH